MTKKKTNWALLGAIGGICAAPFTGGTSLSMTAACGGIGMVGGKVFGTIFGDEGGNDNSTQHLLEQQKLQNEQYKLQTEERRAELERLRKEREKDEQKLRQNNEEIDRLRLIINDPNKSDEDKNRARSRMIVLEDENRKLKSKLGELETKIKKVEDDAPSTPNVSFIPWKFPKLSAYDKALIAAILLVIIYFLFLRG